ncbi:MAG TPA: hypothetical protein VFI41_12605 [Gemmatimonadales bacterium]|nr:hypothetical protein [Gemmatimonadales bacterium]
MPLTPLPRGVLCGTCAQDQWRRFGRERKWQCLPCRREATARWRQRKGIGYALLMTARMRAKRQGVPCTIQESDIVVPATCPVLGIPLYPSAGGAPGPNSPSLDKIRPDDGYVAGNVRVISHRANILKNSATLAELEAVLRDARLKEQH